MHRNAEHVARQLATLGVEGQVRELAEPAPTAATAAAQLGCEVGAIANSLLFNADGAPLLILTSGAHRVDTGKIAAELGVEKVARADPDFVYASTGQRIGGVAPVGHPEPVRTLVDNALQSYDVVWAAAGHAHTVFPTSYDFCEGGSLAVNGGAAVARAISDLLTGPDGGRYDHVVATQDFHVDPGEHFSAHPDYSVSWPPHCVAGTSGAGFHPNLDTGRFEEVFRKGQYAAAYSGFEGVSQGGDSLADWLAERNVADVDIVGIATDYCVRATGLDAAKAGLRATVHLSLTAGVADQSMRAAVDALRSAGVTLTGDRPVASAS
jgi:nicotinamidase/pyrazinamidase